MVTPKFQSQTTSFYSELRNRTNQYFKDRKIEPTGNFQLYSKAVILFSLFIGTYIHLVIFQPSVFIILLECVLMGLLTAFIGFNIMHDGSHGSFSKSKIINTIAGMSMNILGSNVFIWNTKHNVIHHTYTNIDDIDDDIDGKPFLRLSPVQKHYKAHKYQHFYFLGAYALLFMFWIFYTDYYKYFNKRIGNYPMPPLKTSDHISFWVFKIIHTFLFVVFPIYQFGFVNWLIGFTLYGAVTGLVLAIVFQLAHTVEGANFPEAKMPENKMEDEWVMHQMKTTANFATNNRIISWFVGGLNFQIEHHLFPKISHVHYPAISKIVKETCKDFNVNYIEFPSMSGAIASHYRHLKHLGQQ